jgi:uncharacterized membrane protein YphA (DoxX/SURF4 family)
MTAMTQAEELESTESWTRFLPMAARILLGLIFFAAGTFDLLTVADVVPMKPPSPPPPERAMASMEAMMKSGYLFALLKVTETVAGALLLAKRFVPLALAVLAPIVTNIVALHALLLPSRLPVAIVVLALEIYLAWTYRAVYWPMLAARTP